MQQLDPRRPGGSDDPEPASAGGATRTLSIVEQAALLLIDASEQHEHEGRSDLARRFRRHAFAVMRSEDFERRSS